MNTILIICLIILASFVVAGVVVFAVKKYGDNESNEEIKPARTSAPIDNKKEAAKAAKIIKRKEGLKCLSEVKERQINTIRAKLGRHFVRSAVAREVGKMSNV